MNKLKTLLALAVAGLLTGLITGTANAQGKLPEKTDDPLMKVYRVPPTKVNDLIHTKLDVRFDYKKRFMYGKEWVTLKPHFYPTDTLRLDAKYMDIHNISVVKNGHNIPLKYQYQDSLSVAIQLDKVYHNGENYTIYISYTSKPEQVKSKASAAITGAKGLYFINPDSTEKDKPVQIWTQGETEANSCWFPTIDKPEQKTTEEIAMTVPGKYVTLSNGAMILSKKNADGTRTDTWKMDLPISPYLFMMAVGDFKVYHDHWRGKPVDYYLEPKYAPYAKEIFGFTPEAMEFYSKILGVDYPWNKYAQITVRDYLGGSMENASATLHGDQVQETHRELIDANFDVSRRSIAHELFHQWFGDYVTCKTWGYLTMNESFANFSETLWAEHKYGKDAGDAHNYSEMQQYLSNPELQKLDLVRFHYDDKEDMFDQVTYQKGGRILNMMRNYLGDAAFFKGLNIYLKQNALGNGEPQQLRIAEETASGLDLTWFFNEWYYGAGNPALNISYKWDAAAKTETVYVAQTQDGQTFKIPMAIDIYAGGKKERHKVWVNDKADTLTFAVASKPDLVNVDGDKTLVCTKKDDKTLDELAFQYFNAPLYLDRFEAINAAAAHQSDKTAQKVLIAAMKDKYYGLRIKAINALHMSNDDIHNAALPILTSLAQTDGNTLVRAAAINVLGKLKASGNMEIFQQALKSESYAIQGAALTAIVQLDPKQGITLAKGFEKDNKGPLSDAIVTAYATAGGDAEWPFVFNVYKKDGRQGQFDLIRGAFPGMVAKVPNPTYAQQGITEIKEFGVSLKKFGIGPIIVNVLNRVKAGREKLKDDASAKAADDAIKAVNDAP